MPDNNEIVLIRLREAIEAATGRQMRTPKDFSFLSERIFDKLHEHISPTTLKRLWGYLHDTSSTPRPSTLDLLAQYIDYPDFDTFATSVNTTVATTVVPTTSPGDAISPTEAAASDESPAPANDPSPAKPFFKRHSALFIPLAVLLLAVLLAIPFLIRDLRKPPHILKQGSTFATYDDYMQLFGLHSDETHTHFVRLPEHNYICLWAPQYHHPTWHNDGNPDSLMPTIAEYFSPSDPNDSSDVAACRQKNKEYYQQIMQETDVRLVFMKDLFDSTFIYLGVYHVSYDLSDTTRVVWYRVDNDVDLNNLDYLRRHRF